jgi:hypothetical protein
MGYSSARIAAALGMEVEAEPPAVGAAARKKVASAMRCRTTTTARACATIPSQGPLFRTITGKLTRAILPQASAYAMILRRAGIVTKLGNHSFRATRGSLPISRTAARLKSRGGGEPYLDVHDATLRSPKGRGQPR